jgi:hypothetical protein
MHLLGRFNRTEAHYAPLEIMTSSSPDGHVGQAAVGLVSSAAVPLGGFLTLGPMPELRSRRAESGHAKADTPADRSNRSQNCGHAGL